MPDVERQIAEIRGDHVHGAGWLARRAVLVLGQALSAGGAAGVAEPEPGPRGLRHPTRGTQRPVRGGPHLERDLRELVARLMEAKPTMAPVADLVCRLGHEVLQRIRAGDDSAAVGRLAARRAGEIAADAERAAHQSAEQAQLSVWARSPAARG